jgi:hypothetical protein
MLMLKHIYMRHFEIALNEALVAKDELDELDPQEVPDQAEAAAEKAETQGIDDVSELGKAEIEQQYFPDDAQ